MPYRHEIMNEGEFTLPIIPPPPGIVSAPRADVKAAYESTSAFGQIKAEIARQSYQQVFDVAVYRCICQRCPKVWITFQNPAPRTCPSCKSCWWNVPRPANAAPPPDGGFGVTKKKKKVPGRKRGRPRKNAVSEVRTQGAPFVPDSWPEEVPEIPVALLGTVGEPEVAPDSGDRGAAAVDEEAFPVSTPFDIPAPSAAAVDVVADSPLPTGQSTDVGGRSRFADEVMPPPALDPDIDDDWERFGP